LQGRGERGWAMPEFMRSLPCGDDLGGGWRLQARPRYRESHVAQNTPEFGAARLAAAWAKVSAFFRTTIAMRAAAMRGLPPSCSGADYSLCQRRRSRTSSASIRRPPSVSWIMRA